jgi:signal-transduction protein with cAMP-binding, CBS, and nucleotidyltransferase domain
MNEKSQPDFEMNQARGKESWGWDESTTNNQNPGGSMKFNDIKQAMAQCPDFAGLDNESMADLLWRAEEQVYLQGEVIYAEADPLDHTFCLLLQGDLIVEKSGSILAGVFEGQIFGEMAFFINEGRRTATVRAGSAEAVILKFRLESHELQNRRLAALKKCLSLRTWDRFVSVTQNASECDEMVTVC